MSTKHTSGIWFSAPAFTANITGRGRCNLIGIGNGSVHIGYVSITRAVPEEEAKANARLIAAAPELLEAMPTADFWDLVRAGLRSDAGLVFKAVAEQELKAKAAINKATKGAQ